MAAQEQLDALLAVYQGYLADYEQRLVENGPFHGLHKFLLGNSTRSDRKADTDFYNKTEQAVSALNAALTERDSPIAAQAARYMILEAEGPDNTSGLMIEAAQALAIPLAERLDPAERKDILAEYQKRYPKRRMLSPRQRELLAALEA